MVRIFHSLDRSMLMGHPIGTESVRDGHKSRHFEKRMAALSLTEIRDAFDERSMDATTYNTPVQELPNHMKKTKPVNVRLVADETAPSRKDDWRKPRHRDTPESAQESKRALESGGGKRDLKRIATNALTLTIGLALHSAIIMTMNHQFESADVTTFNQICIRFTYPVALLLLVWALKRD